MHHDRPDPNVCPTCGAENQLRELDEPIRWQPVRMGYDAEGVLVPVEYDEWKVSDEGTHRGYECGACMNEWPSGYALAYAQRLRKAFADHRDHAETRAERLQTLADAGRADYVNVWHKIAAAEARAEAFGLALEILTGNGEA